VASATYLRSHPRYAFQEFSTGPKPLFTGQIVVTPWAIT
jgi:hypothetical protein